MASNDENTTTAPVSPPQQQPPQQPSGKARKTLVLLMLVALSVLLVTRSLGTDSASQPATLAVDRNEKEQSRTAQPQASTPEPEAPVVIDDSPRTREPDADARTTSRQKSTRGRGHQTQRAPSIPAHHKARNLIGHLVHGVDHAKVSCGDLHKMYDVESIKKTRTSLAAVEPIGCQRFVNGKLIDPSVNTKDKECGIGLSSLAEAAKLEAAKKKPSIPEGDITLFNRRCPDDDVVAANPKHLVSCHERTRIFRVLVYPSEEAKQATPGIVDDDNTTPEFVDTFQSFPMPQCDAWTYLRCQAYRNASRGLDSTIIDVSTGSDQKRAQPLWPLLWPFWTAASDPYFCGKTGAPARPFHLGDKPYITTSKGRPIWHYVPLNGSRFYRFKDVVHFQGLYLHADEHLTGGKGTANASEVHGDVAALGATFDFAGTFHQVSGLHPREVVSSIRIYPTSLLEAQVAKNTPAGQTPSEVSLDVAYHLPALDFEFSYHVLGDGLFPMLHALRHRLALGLKTSIIMYRPLVTRFGFPSTSCHFGVDVCVAHNPNDGGFGEIVEFVAGGLANVHFVDIPVNRKFPTTSGSIPAYEELRKERATLYSSTIFKIKELIAGTPSQCSLSTTTEMSLIENSDQIRLSRGHLDCVAAMRVFRDVVFTMAKKPSVRDGRKAPASLKKTGYHKEKGDAGKKGARSSKGIGKRVPLECTVHDTIDPTHHKFVSYFIGSGEQCWRDESSVFIPTVTEKPEVVGGDGEEIHIVFLVRRRVTGRVIMEEAELMATIRKHLTLDSVHTRDIIKEAKEKGRSVRLTISEMTSFRQAAQLFSAASILILTHGAAMMYLPFLRPNAAVITIDVVRPAVVPYMPTWVHWAETRPDCVGKPKMCASITFLKAQADIRFNEEQTARLLRRIDALIAAQKDTTIFHY